MIFYHLNCLFKKIVFCCSHFFFRKTFPSSIDRKTKFKAQLNQTPPPQAFNVNNKQTTPNKTAHHFDTEPRPKPTTQNNKQT